MSGAARNRRGGGWRVALALLASGALAGCAGSAPPRFEEPRATSFSYGRTALRGPAAPMAKLPFRAARPRSEPAYSEDDALRGFLSIALRAEAADNVGADGSIAISKWRDPIRYRLVGANQRDRLQIAALARHLTGLTGLDIAEAGQGAPHNMDIRFVPPEFRGVEVAMLAGRGWLGPAVGSLASDWRDFEYNRCFALTTRHPSTGETGTAHIFIKDELDQLWRETCIIEEFAQSLGLLNDDPRVRPSIFNDDGAYLSLTSLDELLLRVLYDPRIRSGMTRRQVEPIARRIIRELRGRDGVPRLDT